MSSKSFTTREKYVQYKNKERARYYTSTALYPPKYWTTSEDITLIRWSGTDLELSKILGRSTKSIQHRRHRLKHGCTCAENVFRELVANGWI